MSLLGTPYTQASITDFNSAYPNNPWAGVTTKERLYYYPVLRDIYRANNVYARFATFKQNLAGYQTKTMNVTGLLDLHPDFDKVGLRDIYAPRGHFDSRSNEITFDRYAGSVAYHRYDEIITYWRTATNNGMNPGDAPMGVIRSIVQNKLGLHMTQVQDMLARNAFLGVPFKLYANGASDFSGITAEDKATTEQLDEIHLGMSYRNVPYANTEDDSIGDIFCITSPGVIFDLQQQADPAAWLTRQAYANPSILLRNEVGTFRNVRFVKSPQATLLNCGAITVQANITSPVTAGDGSPDPNSTLVDETFKVGQPGATHYVQLDAATSAGDMALFHVNDIVSLHVQRTNDFGVTNGVDYRDGKMSNRRIVAVDATNKRLAFQIPVMIDMNTDLGGGVYGYVTKGLHIHSMVFIGGSDGIVMGVGQPPQLHFPRPVDDFDSIWRFSWDSYQGYVNYNPDVLEVLFVGGSYRNVGAMLQG